MSTTGRRDRRAFPARSCPCAARRRRPTRRRRVGVDGALQRQPLLGHPPTLGQSVLRPALTAVRSASSGSRSATASRCRTRAVRRPRRWCDTPSLATRARRRRCSWHGHRATGSPGYPSIGWSEATTPSGPKRARSEASAVSTCSMRCRRPRSGFKFERAACSYAFSAIRTARSPAAWMITCQPSASIRRTMRFRSSGAIAGSLAGSPVAYGSSIAAVRAPMLPSSQIFTAPVLNSGSSGYNRDACASRARSSSVNSRPSAMAEYTRMRGRRRGAPRHTARSRRASCRRSGRS